MPADLWSQPALTYICTMRCSGRMTSREPPSAGRAGAPCGWTPEAEAFFSLSEASPCKTETHRSAKSGQGAAATWTPGRVCTRVQERAMRSHSVVFRMAWRRSLTRVAPSFARGPLLVHVLSPRGLKPRPEAVNFFSLGADGDGAGGGASSSGTSTEAATTWTHAGRAPTLTDCKGDAKVWTPEAISFFTLREAIENEGMKEASREELGRSSGSAWAHSTMVSSFLYASPLMVPARVFS